MFLLLILQARTTVKKNTYEPKWNEQIVFSELVCFLLGFVIGTFHVSCLRVALICLLLKIN